MNSAISILIGLVIVLTVLLSGLTMYFVASAIYREKRGKEVTKIEKDNIYDLIITSMILAYRERQDKDLTDYKKRDNIYALIKITVTILVFAVFYYVNNR
jgi:hypothetical protein